MEPARPGWRMPLSEAFVYFLVLWFLPLATEPCSVLEHRSSDTQEELIGGINPRWGTLPAQIMRTIWDNGAVVAPFAVGGSWGAQLPEEGRERLALRGLGTTTTQLPIDASA
jgi:hypothetical protein